MKLQEILTRATPRPWKARDREISGNDLLIGEIYRSNILDNTLPGQPSFEEGQANKHLIIRSVNAFEPLLEACNRTLQSAAFALMHADDRRFIKEIIHRVRVG